jgi:hypothetical protein
MITEGQAGRRARRQQGNAVTSLTQLGSLPVAQMEGEGDEGTRCGMRFQVSATGATGIAPVQALPTVAAQWFWGNPIANTKTIFVDELGVVLVSGVGGANGTLYVAMCAPTNMPATFPAMSAGVVISNRSPISGNTSKLIVASAQTLVGTTGFWYPMAWEDIANTLAAQTQMMHRDIRGRIGLAPGTGIGFAVVSPTGTTPLWAPVGLIREYESDNE